MEDLIPEGGRGGHPLRRPSARTAPTAPSTRGRPGPSGAPRCARTTSSITSSPPPTAGLLFFNLGRVYRIKAYETRGRARHKGQHVASLLWPSSPARDRPGHGLGYGQADLVLATRRGLVKKTRLGEYDSNRSGGVIAIQPARERGPGVSDELVSAPSLLCAGRTSLCPATASRAPRRRRGPAATTAGRPPASPVCASGRATHCWPWA